MIYYSVCIWFTVIVFIVNIFIAFVSISNCIEYKNIINSGGNDNISKEKANYLYIINIIASIASIVIFFWIIYIWIYTQKKRNEKLGKN
jgi:uncharacterized BrkB/YihY/UPF0761 family membrane protein